MTRLVRLAFPAVALAGLLACNQERATENKPVKLEGATQASATRPAEAAAPPAIRMGGELAPDQPRTMLSQIPVAEELENEAADSIGVDNIEAELDRIEAEIVKID